MHAKRKPPSNRRRKPGNRKSQSIMRNRNRNRAPKKTIDSSKSSFAPPQDQDYYEGERLARLLKLIKREIESVKLAERKSLPEKFWYKQQFAIGINEVTRLLERMSPMAASAEINSTTNSLPQQPQLSKGPSVQLQAILIASDCNPKWLTKHLPYLASSRKVPLILVKDKKAGSLRLGELVKLKTAIAIGVKAKGNAINQIVEEILCGNEINLESD